MTLALLVIAAGLRITDASRVVVYSASPLTPVVPISSGAAGASWLCLDRTGGPSCVVAGTNPPLDPEHVSWIPWVGSPAEAVLLAANGLTVSEWFTVNYGANPAEALAWHRSAWWGDTVLVADPVVALEVVCERHDSDPCDAWPSTGLPPNTVVNRPWQCPPVRIRWAGSGDIDMNGLVNAGDFAAFIARPYDYDQTGAVDILDFKSVQDAIAGSSVIGIDQDPTWRRYIELTANTATEP